MIGAATGAGLVQDNAGIFFYSQPPSPEQIIAAARGASTETQLESKHTRVTATWPDVTLVITIDPTWNRDLQLKGMRNWIGKFDAAFTDTPATKELLAHLDRTTTGYGSMITPAYDPEGKVAATLLRLVEPTGGFFFSHQSFYDSRGRRIIGLPGDPQQLGPRGRQTHENFMRPVRASQWPAGYRVFTTKFDVELRAERLSEVIGLRESSAFADYVTQFERAMAHWHAVAQPVATQFVNGVKAGNEGPDLGDTIACLLIDHSGSMRGQPSILAASLASIVADCWHKLGIRYEILGFTTQSWKGGRPRRLWLQAGRPANPGRLCELLHIVYRSADDTCPGAPDSIRNLMREDLLKENVDGEAVIWAAERLRKRPETRKLLVVVSDGAPVDDSTLSVNHGGILDRHLKEVVAALRHASDIRVGAIGLGYDVSRYYAEGIVISSPDDLTDCVLAFLAGLVKDPAGSASPRRNVS